MSIISLAIFLTILSPYYGQVLASEQFSKIQSASNKSKMFPIHFTHSILGLKKGFLADYAGVSSQGSTALGAR